MLSEGHDKSAVLKNLVNVFRRLHRIFAHAWFQHRGVFWSVEAQTGLYAFFKTACDMYDLLPAENYKLPPEAEGLEPIPTEKEDKKPTVTAIAKPPSQQHEGAEYEDERHSLHARRSNTARHSSRPSTGSAVTTVIEEREDEHHDVTNKLKGLHISAPETVEEESEVEVPVIVEGELLDNPSVQAAEASQVHEYQEKQDEAPPHSVKIDVREDVSAEPGTVTENAEQQQEGSKEVPLFGYEQVAEDKANEPAPSAEKQPEATADDTDTTQQPEASAPKEPAKNSPTVETAEEKTAEASSEAAEGEGEEESSSKNQPSTD